MPGGFALMMQMLKFIFQEVRDGQMVRATDRHISRLYRYGCRDGAAAAAQFLSLNDKTMFDPQICPASAPVRQN
jgi:hypothetical protein